MPIKRSEYLKPLSRDHHFSLLFVWKIRQGIKQNIAVERVSKYVSFFSQNVLLPHFKEEELCLFIYSKSVDTVRALGQHKAILQKVNALEASSSALTYEQLSAIADEVEAHVRFEERILFPQLENTLSEKELVTVMNALNNHPPIKDDYADVFWERVN